MPSVVSSYIYTFAALTAVSALLIYSLYSYTATLRNMSEMAQLKNILNEVATKANELLTLVETTNSSVRAFVLLPNSIGSQQYWIQLRNDSSSAWLEGFLGQMVGGDDAQRVFLPPKTLASGYFIAGHGPALLECYLNGSAPRLNLTSSGG